MQKEYLNAEMIALSNFSNHKEATFLISVLDEPDLYKRVIPEKAGKKYCSTIIGYPLVAKLRLNDFGGHEQKIKNGKNGKEVSFDTIAIGSFLDAWVEEREVEGYEGKPECILAKAKLWTTRFPKYFKVFDRLWKNGQVQSSWELVAYKKEMKDDLTIFNVFEFIGNAVLGSKKTPAVPGAGVIEYAEIDDLYVELAEALEADIANCDVVSEKEEKDLADKKKKKDIELDESVQQEETKKEDVKETETETEVKEIEKDKEKAETQEEVKDEEKESSVNEQTDTHTEEEEVNTEDEHTEEGDSDVAEKTMLTNEDIFKKLLHKVERYGYIAFLFPEEHIFLTQNYNQCSLEFFKFTYSIDADGNVEVSEPETVRLAISPLEINDTLKNKDTEIAELKSQINEKNEKVIEVCEKIESLEKEIVDLKPYKEQVEKAEAERIEAEIASAKKELKNKLLDSKLFDEEEVAQAEIAELIEKRDTTAINNLIADRYMSKITEKDIDETNKVESASTENVSVNLEEDMDIESEIDTKSAMQIFFRK